MLDVENVYNIGIIQQNDHSFVICIRLQLECSVKCTIA